IPRQVIITRRKTAHRERLVCQNSGSALWANNDESELMDWSALTAGATATAAAAALTAAMVTWRVGNRQVRSADIANGVNLAIQIRAHVNSAEFRAARYRAATALLAGEYTSYVVYVLDELETVGLLINKRALDQEIIWTMLSALVINYVAAARPFV